jgi:hypothetical protein
MPKQQKLPLFDAQNAKQGHNDSLLWILVAPVSAVKQIKRQSKHGIGGRKMAIKCCKDCVAPKRYPGCHDHCLQYIQEKTAYEEKMAAANKKKAIEDGLTSQTVTSVNRANKRRKGWM